MAIDGAKTIVLVTETGANRGIGYEIVAAPLRQLALASLKPEHGNSASLLHLDVTLETGRMDILMNNVSIVSTASNPMLRLRETLEVNLVTQFAVMEAFRMLFLAQPVGRDEREKRLIHTTSDWESIGMRTKPSSKVYDSPFREYRISQDGLNVMTACHQYEMLKSGVKVCDFNPGYTVMELTGDAEAPRDAKVNNLAQADFARALWERIRRECTYIPQPFSDQSTLASTYMCAAPTYSPSVPIRSPCSKPAQFGAFMPWLVVHRGPLRVLIHPNTAIARSVEGGDGQDGMDEVNEEEKNHTTRAIWLGERVLLDLGLFEAMREREERKNNEKKNG
ncbi:hypothetical protein VTN00DRAFT_7239 [Thermoascus crustaceus]|uniref:uncharacterized protein n=1 Tax=Thermoascus crustaceus TaxID=5088 RepID=UPI0037437532